MKVEESGLYIGGKNLRDHPFEKRLGSTDWIWVRRILGNVFLKKKLEEIWLDAGR